MAKVKRRVRSGQRSAKFQPPPPRRPKVQAFNGQTLQRAVTQAFDHPTLADLRFHGNTQWLVADLVLLTMLWVWSNQRSLTAAFTEARQTLRDLQRDGLTTYQGFIAALTTATPTLLPPVQERLRTAMADMDPKHFRINGWVTLAVDGSRASAPRTHDNEKHLCARHYGQSNKAKRRQKQRAQKSATRVRQPALKAAPQGPQVWLTMLWHMGLKMPWGWRHGPSDSSEREHFRELVEELDFPDKTLFCADAGFTGYDLWHTLQERGHHFLIRVGANVRLLQQLGYHAEEHRGLVYLWPDAVAKQNRPPLVLRLLRFQTGRKTVVLVTNVLNPNELRMANAQRMYRLRWGIEVQFRSFKQTFERRVLRSRTAARVFIELDWSLVGLWLVQLFAVREQLRLGHLPEHCSVGLALHLFRETLRRWWERPPKGLTWFDQLGKALKDGYPRRGSKRARYRPNRGSQPKCGVPRIQRATKQHKQRLQKVLAKIAKKSFTA